jgi:hypothetical protein
MSCTTRGAPKARTKRAMWWLLWQLLPPRYTCRFLFILRKERSTMAEPVRGLAIQGFS